jgi:hypothetical protein
LPDGWRGSDTYGPAARSNRVFILVFDESDLETSALQRIKKGALDFVETQSMNISAINLILSR